MKKFLFISNISNRITNFSIPSILAAQKLGYEVHMAANYSEFNDDPSKYNVILHHIDIARNPFSLRNIRAYKQMLELMKKEKFDIIHCNTPVGGMLGRLCGRRSKISKIIYTAHGFHFYKGAPLINRTLFKFVEKYLAHYTDSIITINKEDYEAAKKFKLKNSGKVYYVPGVGIDVEKIKNSIEKRSEIVEEIGANYDDTLIISVGELNENKNNKVIIKALGRLKDSKIHYLLCGVGKKYDELIQLSKKENVEKNVHFLGYRKDIYELLKSADIFVMPSYREGLSRSIMEAMACGIPIIASKIRGNVDLVKDGYNGYLVDSDDFVKISDRVIELTKYKSKRRKMSDINLEIVKQYDCKNIIDNIENIYMRVIL